MRNLTFRLPYTSYAHLVDLAEKRGASVSDTARYLVSTAYSFEQVIAHMQSLKEDMNEIKERIDNVKAATDMNKGAIIKLIDYMNDNFVTSDYSEQDYE